MPFLGLQFALAWPALVRLPVWFACAATWRPASCRCCILHLGCCGARFLPRLGSPLLPAPACWRMPGHLTRPAHRGPSCSWIRCSRLSLSSVKSRQAAALSSARTAPALARRPQSALERSKPVPTRRTRGRGYPCSPPLSQCPCRGCNSRRP